MRPRLSSRYDVAFLVLFVQLPISGTVQSPASCDGPNCSRDVRRHAMLELDESGGIESVSEMQGGKVNESLASRSSFAVSASQRKSSATSNSSWRYWPEWRYKWARKAPPPWLRRARGRWRRTTGHVWVSL